MASNAPLLINDDTLGFGEEDEPKGKLRHPVITFFHVAFRSAALLMYIFSRNNFIASFVTIILLLSMDFWTVKNITGRIMVGLRWWNYIDEEGNSHWVYEARKGDLQGRVSTTEVNIFWTTLVLFPVLWSLFLLIAVFTFNFRWVIIVCIALSLNCSNLYGYIRCKLGKSEGVTQSIKGLANSVLQRQLYKNMTSVFTGAKSPPTTGPNTTV